MSNEIRKALRTYCDAKFAGKSNTEALAIARKTEEIGHSVADLAWYADTRNPNHTPDLRVAPDQVEAAVVALRGGKGWNGYGEGTALSWGRIGIAIGWYDPATGKSPEGRIRTVFGRATGLASEGTRIGRGGRWLSDDRLLYVGNHKGIGVEDPKPRLVDRAALAAGADTYTSKVAALAAKQATAAKRARKPRTPKAG